MHARYVRLLPRILMTSAHPSSNRTLHHMPTIVCISDSKVEFLIYFLPAGRDKSEPSTERAGELQR